MPVLRVPRPLPFQTFVRPPLPVPFRFWEVQEKWEPVPLTDVVSRQLADPQREGEGQVVGGPQRCMQVLHWCFLLLVSIVCYTSCWVGHLPRSGLLGLHRGEVCEGPKDTAADLTFNRLARFRAVTAVKSGSLRGAGGRSDHMKRKLSEKGAGGSGDGGSNSDSLSPGEKRRELEEEEEEEHLGIGADDAALKRQELDKEEEEEHLGLGADDATLKREELEEEEEEEHHGLGWLPIVDFGSMTEKEAADAVVEGFKGSGFLLVKTPEVTRKKMKEVLKLTASIFQGSEAVNAPLRASVKVHEKDPKSHVMLERLDRFRSSPQADPVLVQYWESLVIVKRRILAALAMGLGLPADYFTSRHKDDNDSLRLLHYPPVPDTDSDEEEDQKLRCKEHSDYGSITILLRDDCAGLQLLREDCGWSDVPYKSGTLVVNAGSMLNRWTGGAVKATLHRVAAVPGACHRDRYSAAFFADVDASVELKDLGQDDPKLANMTAAEYVTWRSGGGDGVAFLPGEAEDQGAIHAPAAIAPDF